MLENKNQETPSYLRPVYRQPSFWIAIISSIIIVVLGIIFIPKLLSTPEEPTPEPTPAAETTNKDKTKTDEEKPKESTEDNQTTTTEPSVSETTDGKTPEQYDGENPNDKEELTGSISAARFSGDKLIIRVNIDQYLSNGTCSLTLTSGSNVLEENVSIVPVVSNSTCEGFDIPSSQLANFSRPININIKLSTAEKSGTLTGEVE